MSDDVSGEITITVESEENAASGAAELQELIAQDAPADFQIGARRDPDSETQDFGATLIAILGTGAAIAIAKGIRSYLSKRGDRVHVKLPSGAELVITGDAAANIKPEALATAIDELS